MKQFAPIRRISAKRLAEEFGGIMPYSTISRRYRFVSTSHKRKGGAVCASKLAAEGRMKKRKQQGNSKAAASRQQTSGRRIHPERSGGEHERIRLTGAARSRRRAEIFERAGGRCEEQVPYRIYWSGKIEYGRCNNKATEWSHKKHGARKCDCMECGIASCAECHRRKHAGGKPCPKKATV